MSWFGRQHSLDRSPLSPAVPLEGSESVQGLRTLERQRLTSEAAAAQPSAPDQPGAPAIPTGRRTYQRFKGPYIEQLAVEDLKAAPKPWGAFAGGSVADYSVPASIAALQERMEENLVTYLPNYLRLALVILLLVMYLRPIALLGTLGVAATTYFNAKRLLEPQARQQQLQQQQQQGGRAAARAGAGAGTAGSDDDAAAAAAPATALATLGTWLLVAYTRCLPMILLAALLSATAIALHAAARQAPSEARRRGKQPVAYSLAEVLGRAPVQPPGSEPRLLFKQAWWLVRGAATRRGRLLARRFQYWGLALRDTLRFRGSARRW